MKDKSIHVASKLRSVRAELFSTISSLDNFVVNGQSSSVQELINHLKDHSADIFIIYDEFVQNDSIHLVDSKSVFPFSFKIKTVVICLSTNLLFISNLVKNSTWAYIHLSDVTPSVIEEALHAVTQDQLYFSPTVIKLLQDKEIVPKRLRGMSDSELVPKLLSHQELQVLRLMDEDYSLTAGMIGEKLGGKTSGHVKSVWKRIKLKLNLKSSKTKLALVKFALIHRIFR